MFNPRKASPSVLTDLYVEMNKCLKHKQPASWFTSNEYKQHHHHISFAFRFNKLDGEKSRLRFKHLWIGCRFCSCTVVKEEDTIYSTDIH